MCEGAQVGGGRGREEGKGVGEGDSGEEEEGVFLVCTSVGQNCNIQSSLPPSFPSPASLSLPPSPGVPESQQCGD